MRSDKIWSSKSNICYQVKIFIIKRKYIFVYCSNDFLIRIPISRNPYLQVLHAELSLMCRIRCCSRHSLCIPRQWPWWDWGMSIDCILRYCSSSWCHPGCQDSRSDLRKSAAAPFQRECRKTECCCLFPFILFSGLILWLMLSIAMSFVYIGNLTFAVL